MKKLLALMLVLLAGCGGKDKAVSVIPPDESKPVIVERSNRLLIAPFDCTILASDPNTMLMLQNQVSSQLVFMLQLAEVPAEQHIDGMAERVADARAYASLMPGGYSIGQGLLPGRKPVEQPAQAVPSAQALGPATSFEEIEDWDAQVVPPRNIREFGNPAVGVAIDDTDLSLQPVAEEPKLRASRQKLLEEARTQGYDYVVVGTISHIRTDISPTIFIGGAERATVRCEINIAAQLISTETGKVRQLGAARGRDGKMIVVREGELNGYHVYGALDKIVHESVKVATKRIAEQLANRSLDEYLTNEELANEADYYQDSPGKRLKPRPAKKK